VVKIERQVFTFFVRKNKKTENFKNPGTSRYARTRGVFILKFSHLYLEPSRHTFLGNFRQKFRIRNLCYTIVYFFRCYVSRRILVFC